MKREIKGYVDPGAGVTFVSGIVSVLVGLASLLLGFVVLTFKKWIHWFKRLLSKVEK